MSDEIEIEEFMPGIYSDVPEVIKEIFHRMPWGQEVVLANGRKGKIVTFYEPKKDAEGRWKFGLDVRFDHGSPDHLEFIMNHTGGGGFVG